MKLKGVLSSKIPLEKKRKMEKTLERMNKIREEFDMRLRDKIAKEQELLEIEYKKLQALLQKLEEQRSELNKQINDTKIEMVKLRASFAALDKVIKEAGKEE